MSDCRRFQFLLAAHHDGELRDHKARRALEEHLVDCPHCAAELAQMRDLSAQIASAIATREGVTERAVIEMHRAVDEVMNAAVVDQPFLRTAGLLTGLAASVLIISGIWLFELNRSEAGDGISVADAPVVLSPDWERVAMTLRAEPRPAIGGDSVFSPRYAAAIDWMLDNLVPERPAKPG
jgi:anti-sigma factor RsiW